MKVVIFTVFASLAFVGVFGEDLYGEKDDAINEIKTKYNGIFEFAHGVIEHIQSEMDKREPTKEEEALKYANQWKTTALVEFSAELKKAARTAVAKGKPQSVFECLANTALEGRGQVLGMKKNFEARVNATAGNRSKRLYIVQVEAALVLNAITELKDQSLADIQKAESGIQSLKNDAVRKMESGKKLLTQIENSILKPTLVEEYINIKREMDIKFKELKDALFRRVQKCIA